MNSGSALKHGAKIALGLAPLMEMSGDDNEDTDLLREMADEAERYISSFTWCSGVRERYFGGGIGGIFAVFFLRIDPDRKGIDPWIRVMAGDIPPAYLPVSDCDSPQEAFQMYIAGMTRWAELALEGQDVECRDDVPPVDMPATPEWAELLNKKLEALRLVAAPFFEERAYKWIH